ncbi:MAG: acetolactate decarboxylase, partial [Thermodesulfobacteriota bacterium]
SISGFMLTACSEGGASDSDNVNRIFQWGADNPTYLTSRAKPSEVVDPTGIGVGGAPGGEIIVFGGKALITDSSGAVSELDDDDEIAVIGVMSNFQADYTTVTTDTVGCEDDLADYLDDIVGDDEVDRLAVFLIRGTFSSIDYAVEAGVIEDTPIFSIEDVSGTMVGYKSPYYFGDDTFVVENITVGIAEFPWHVHFISDDETIMGHVRECEIDPGNDVEIALANIFDLQLNYQD